MNGPTSESHMLDRLTDEQLETIRGHRERESDADLLRVYELCRDGLKLESGIPPKASAIQYFLSAWRELRRRKQE